jgi:hypothetical protein
MKQQLKNGTDEVKSHFKGATTLSIKGLICDDRCRYGECRGAFIKCDSF